MGFIVHFQVTNSAFYVGLFISALACAYSYTAKSYSGRSRASVASYCGKGIGPRGGVSGAETIQSLFERFSLSIAYLLLIPRKHCYMCKRRILSVNALAIYTRLFGRRLDTLAHRIVKVSAQFAVVSGANKENFAFSGIPRTQHIRLEKSVTYATARCRHTTEPRWSKIQ